MLGVEQRHLADLLQVVLDRVRGRARHGHLSGRQVIIVVAENQDLLVLAAVRDDLDHARPGRFGPLGLGLGVQFRGGPGLRPFEHVHALRVAVAGQVVAQLITGQVVGGRRHVGQIGLVQVTLGERGLDVRVVRVQLAELVVKVLVVRISVVQAWREVLVETHHGQAGVRVGALLRTVLAGIRESRTGYRSCLVLDGHLLLARRPGALPRCGVSSAHDHGHPFLRWLEATRD